VRWPRANSTHLLPVLPMPEMERLLCGAVLVATLPRTAPLPRAVPGDLVGQSGADRRMKGANP